MGDPVGAARHVREALAADGTWMIVEPIAGDRVEDNLNPVGRAYYGFSTLLCTPASLSQEVGLALGAQAGEARIRDVVDERRLHALPPRRRDAVQPRVRGAAVTCETIDPGARSEQTRARYPDSEGYVERDGVRIFYEVYGSGEADRAAAADLVDRALALLEGADPVPRAALPRRHLRRPRQRAVGPPATRRRPTPRRSSPPMRSPCSTRPAPTRGARRRLSLRRAARRCCSPPSTPSGSRASSSSARRCRSPVADAERAGELVRRRARRRTRAGRSTTATTGSSDYRGFLRVLLLADASPSRTRPSRSRTASAGGSRRRPRR